MVDVPFFVQFLHNVDTTCSALSAISGAQDLFDSCRPPLTFNPLYFQALIGFAIETDVHYGLSYEVTKLPVVQNTIPDFICVHLAHLETRSLLTLAKLLKHVSEFAATSSLDLVPICVLVGR